MQIYSNFLTIFVFTNSKLVFPQKNEMILWVVGSNFTVWSILRSLKEPYYLRALTLYELLLLNAIAIYYYIYGDIDFQKLNYQVCLYLYFIGEWHPLTPKLPNIKPPKFIVYYYHWPNQRKRGICYTTQWAYQKSSDESSQLTSDYKNKNAPKWKTLILQLSQWCFCYLILPIYICFT